MLWIAYQLPQILTEAFSTRRFWFVCTVSSTVLAESKPLRTRILGKLRPNKVKQLQAHLMSRLWAVIRQKAAQLDEFFNLSEVFLFSQDELMLPLRPTQVSRYENAKVAVVSACAEINPNSTVFDVSAFKLLCCKTPPDLQAEIEDFNSAHAKQQVASKVPTRPDAGYVSDDDLKDGVIEVAVPISTNGYFYARQPLCAANVDGFRCDIKTVPRELAIKAYLHLYDNKGSAFVPTPPKNML